MAFEIGTTWYFKVLISHLLVCSMSREKVVVGPADIFVGGMKNSILDPF